MKNENIGNLNDENMTKSTNFEDENTPNFELLQENSLEKEIYNHILALPECRMPDIVKMIGKSKSTIERTLKTLREGGLIEYKGALKNGGYFVNKIDTPENEQLS